MQIKLEAQQLTTDALTKLGYNSQDAQNRQAGSKPQSDIEITREAPAAAQIDGKDGQDGLGYVFAYQAARIAIEKAKKVGLAVVGANNTWYTGMLSYYAEMAAKENPVAIIASNCTPWVAPEGGYRPMFGTNPFCIGFPKSWIPVLYDIGTSPITYADVKLAQRTGKELPPDLAFDKNGEPTTDPFKAFEGALSVWGGPRGSGLAIAVQLLGVVAGSPALPPDLKDFGFLIMTIHPTMFRPLEEYKAEVDEFVMKMKEGPPVPGGPALRMPFERSNATRAQNRAAGKIEVEDVVFEKLQALISS